MKSILHLLKKDFLRNRLLLIFWAAAVLITAMADAWQFVGEDPTEWTWFLRSVAVLAYLMAGALTLVLVARLVLEDPVDDPTAFWATRPISGGQLLAEKLMALVLIGAIPTAISMGLLVWQGVTARELGLAAAAEGMGRGAILFSLAALASLARGFGGFVIRLVAVGAGAGFIAAVVHSILRARDFSWGALLPETMIASGQLAQTVLAIVLGAGLLARAYFARHARLRGVGIYLAALTLVLTPILWSWDFIAGKKPTSPVAIESAEFTLSAPRLVVETGIKGTQTVFGRLKGMMLANGDVAIPLGATGAVLTGVNGRRLTISDKFYSSRLIQGSVVPVEQAPDALRQTLAPLRLLNPPVPQSRKVNLGYLRGQELAKASADEHFRLHAEIVAMLARCEPEEERPLVAGAGAGEHGKFAIQTVSSQGNQFIVTIEERTFSASILEGKMGSWSTAFIERAARLAASQHEVLYLLVNRERGEALLADTSKASYLRRLGELSRNDRRLEFRSVALPDAAWLRAARLLRVQFEWLGPVRVPLRAEGVSLHE